MSRNQMAASRPPLGSPERRGFTLLELACVVGVISVLLSLSISSYAFFLRRARDAEALVNLQTIAHLEQVSMLERGHFVGCAPSPEELPQPRSRFAQTEGWPQLGFRIEGPVHHQYGVDLSAEQSCAFERMGFAWYRSVLQTLEDRDH